MHSPIESGVSHKDLGGIWLVQQTPNSFLVYEACSSDDLQMYEITQDYAVTPIPAARCPARCKIIPFSVVVQLRDKLNRKRPKFSPFRFRKAFARLFSDKSSPLFLVTFPEKVEVEKRKTPGGWITPFGVNISYESLRDMLTALREPQQ